MKKAEKIEKYEEMIMLLDYYFEGMIWRRYFLEGGCYWFANYLYERIPGSYIVVDRVYEHCAISIDGKVYDVTGQVSRKNFRRASAVDISFMKRYYKPKIDVVSIEKYLAGKL